MEFALGACRAFGRARILMLAQLGEPLPSRRYLAKRLVKIARKRLRRRLKGRHKPVAERNAALRQAELRGMLSERMWRRSGGRGWAFGRGAFFGTCGRWGCLVLRRASRLGERLRFFCDQRRGRKPHHRQQCRSCRDDQSM